MVVTLHWLIFAKPHMRTDALWIGVFYTPAWAGVWIFFLLGGYLAGRSFIYGRYKLTIPGIKRYYLRRIMRLAPPYYLFCLLCIIFFSPTFPFSSWFACLRIITFTYNGIPGATGLGATWYISTTMQLYILAPLVTIIIFKLKKYANIIFMLLLILGFSIRIISYLFNINPYITYTSFYGNIDIFFCGICINFMQIKINIKNNNKNIKEKRTAKTEPKTEEIVIPIQRKLWRLLKPLLTYELFLIGATVLLALILMTFTTGGYLEERMHATSVLASAIGSLAAIPVLWKQYKKDEGMFPKPEKRWSAAEAAACILLVMTFGHLLNTVMNVTGFTRIFSGYQDMASKIYEGQNPLLLILSVGVLSAAAEEIVFRGMIYRRAKDFWGTGWGIAASCLLFGAYHGNVTPFVYAAVVSVLLILIYERCGTLLAPVLAHMAENIWGLYRSQFVSWMTQKAPAGAWMFVFLEAVICAGTFWYLFLKDKQGKTQK